MDPIRWQRIEGLFLAALERQGEARHSFLLEATRDDPMLRAEVEGMLAAQAESRALAAEAELLRDSPHEPEAWARSRLSAEARVGPYRLIERIGRGGMGVMYRAERADGEYVRTVAVKLIRAGVVSPELL